ncbi:MAG: DUF4260 domain-containing protein [Chitinophagaceae bacterium]
MKKIIQLEEAAMSGISIYALYLLKVEWWFYLLLLFAPDVSMIGYVAGNKTGAITYNLFHHKAIAIFLFMIGLVNQIWMLQVIGTILFGHSSLDRILSYGLKYFTGSKYTHLGEIGLNKSNN